jgi:hypothetical protein
VAIRIDAEAVEPCAAADTLPFEPMTPAAAVSLPAAAPVHMPASSAGPVNFAATVSIAAAVAVVVPRRTTRSTAKKESQQRAVVASVAASMADDEAAAGALQPTSLPMPSAPIETPAVESEIDILMRKNAERRTRLKQESAAGGATKHKVVHSPEGAANQKAAARPASYALPEDEAHVCTKRSTRRG